MSLTEQHFVTPYLNVAIHIIFSSLGDHGINVKFLQERGLSALGLDENSQ
jgi:hypothetical protein